LIDLPTTLKRSLGIALLVACGGCTAGGDDDSDGGGDLLILPLSREPTSQGLTLTLAELSFHDISVVSCVVDAAELHTYDFPIDLFNDPPANLEFISAVTDFCGVSIEIAPASGSDLPDLQGLSVLFRGTRADAVPFEVRSTLDVNLDLETGAALDAAHLVLGVDLDAWLTNVDVSGADATEDGVTIDAEHNPDLLSTFDAAVSSAVALYVDTNGDRTLTGDELTPVATAPTQ
jgi:hypothetical protein